MASILVIGPKALAPKIGAALEGSQVLWADDEEKALEMASGQALGLVILDMEAPGAREVAQRFQEPAVPILALVSDPSHPDLSGQGIQDFLVKPWRSEELQVRARRLLARALPPEDRDILQVGDLTLDLARYQVSVAGRPVDLTYMEHTLLKFLASHPGRVFSREALLNRVWGYDYLGGSRTVDVHIRRLRSKLEDQHHSFIETVRNVGYRLKAAP